MKATVVGPARTLMDILLASRLGDFLRSVTSTSGSDWAGPGAK